MRIFRLEPADPQGQPILATEGADGGYAELEGGPLGPWRPTGRSVPRGLARLAPVAPSQILCIGLNYRKHAEETGARFPEHPVLFTKNLSALQHPGRPISLPRTLRSDQVDYECELVVILGKDCCNATAENALDFVLGYTCGNDVSARDWQKGDSGGQWCRGKGFDTFAPMGPCLVTADELGDGSGLGIRTEIGGEVLQDSTTSDMIFGVRDLIVFLSGSTTLPAGTAIYTGTPSGVGMARDPRRWLVPGDRVTIEIEKIGRLENPVEEESI